MRLTAYVIFPCSRAGRSSVDHRYPRWLAKRVREVRPRQKSYRFWRKCMYSVSAVPDQLVVVKPFWCSKTQSIRRSVPASFELRPRRTQKSDLRCTGERFIKVSPRQTFLSPDIFTPIIGFLGYIEWIVVDPTVLQSIWALHDFC